MTNLTDDQIIEKALEILASRVIGSEPLSSPKTVIQFLTVALSDRERETFGIVYLNSQHRVIAFEELFHGTIDGAAVYPREVAKAALAHNAAALILAHNHPSGIAEPSSADRRITERLCAALSLLDIKVLDHIIIAGGNHYIFAERGLL